jgi:hypothetical protein
MKHPLMPFPAFQIKLAFPCDGRCSQITGGKPEIAEKNQREKKKNRSKCHLPVKNPFQIIALKIQRTEPPEIDKKIQKNKIKHNVNNTQTDNSGT